MAERIVRGWKVSLQKLAELVGSQCLTAREILTSELNSPCLEDVLMTLGEGDAEDGTQIAEGALTAILAGKLEHEAAYDYARVIEPLLNRVAIPLGNTEGDQILLQLTYYFPNDSHGRWNPVLQACNLPKLAVAWAAPNVDFPWTGSAGPDREDYPWPVWTCFDVSMLPELAAELGRVTKQQIDALSVEILVEDRESVDDCRNELWQGLQRLRGWIDRAQAPQEAEGVAWTKTGNVLMLVMDGDQ